MVLQVVGFTKAQQERVLRFAPFLMVCVCLKSAPKSTMILQHTYTRDECECPQTLVTTGQGTKIGIYGCAKGILCNCNDSFLGVVWSGYSTQCATGYFLYECS